MNITEPLAGPYQLDDAGPNSGNIIRFEVFAADRHRTKLAEIEDSSVDAKQKRKASAQDEANANLLRASWELLEACKQAAAALPTDHAAFNTVRRAIASAYGQK